MRNPLKKRKYFHQLSQVLSLAIASTFIGHRKYFRFFAHFCGILDRIHFTQLCSLLKFRMCGSYSS